MTRDAEHTPSPQSVVVPVEPTEAMLRAVSPISGHRVWSAMLASAPAPSSLAGGEEAEFATALARVLDRHGLRDAGWADAAIDEALSVVREPSAVSRATVDAILPMISERLAALSPEAPAREGVVMAASDAPMWADGIVTDGENVAMAQKAETDHGGDYWAVDGGNGGLDWEPTHFISLDAPTPRHEAPARNPLDPDAPSEAMIDAGLKVDWSNEDERGTVINVWYAMNAARRHEAPASHAFEASHSVQREGGCKVCGHDEASHEAPAEGAGDGLSGLSEAEFRVIYAMRNEADTEFAVIQEAMLSAFDRENNEPDYDVFVRQTEDAAKALNAIWNLRARSSAPEARSTVSVLAEALHDRMFGVSSLKDPALALAEISDGGGLHEAAHELLRALPLRGSAPEAREGEAVAWVPVGLDGLPEWELTYPEDASSKFDPDRTPLRLYTHPAAPSTDKLRIAVEASGFLLDRLSDLEQDVNERDFYGHVHPAASRLRQALAALKAEGA